MTRVAILFSQRTSIPGPSYCRSVPVTIDMANTKVAKEFYEVSKLSKYDFEPYWPDKKLKICVTGAGGFIASHLAKRLKSEGHYIIGCDWKRNEHMPVCRPSDIFLIAAGPEAYALRHTKPLFVRCRRRCFVMSFTWLTFECTIIAKK